MAYLSASVFAASYFDIGNDLRNIEKRADYLHIDIMDGHFVPLFGLNSIVSEQLSKSYKIRQDIHIMARNPKNIIPQFFIDAVESITIHVECGLCNEIRDLLDLIASGGKRSGLAISPETDIIHLIPFLDKVEDILIMSSIPGQPNSVFEAGTYERIDIISKYIKEKNYDIEISVDGGLDFNKAAKCKESGANKVVIGRAFFAENDKNRLIEKIHNM